MRMLAYSVLAGATILAVVPATAQRHDPRFPYCMERVRSGRGSISVSPRRTWIISTGQFGGNGTSEMRMPTMAGFERWTIR